MIGGLLLSPLMTIGMEGLGIGDCYRTNGKEQEKDTDPRVVPGTLAVRGTTALPEWLIIVVFPAGKGLGDEPHIQNAPSARIRACAAPMHRG